MSVEETQRKVSSTEFAQWVALNAIEPWVPSLTEYIGAAVVAAEVHNGFQSFLKPEDQEMKPATDFIPEWDTAEVPEVEETEEETAKREAELLFQKSSMVFMALGGVDTTKGKPN